MAKATDSPQANAEAFDRLGIEPATGDWCNELTYADGSSRRTACGAGIAAIDCGAEFAPGRMLTDDVEKATGWSGSFVVGYIDGFDGDLENVHKDGDDEYAAGYKWGAEVAQLVFGWGER